MRRHHKPRHRNNRNDRPIARNPSLLTAWRDILGRAYSWYRCAHDRRIDCTSVRVRIERADVPGLPSPATVRRWWHHHAPLPICTPPAKSTTPTDCYVSSRTEPALNVACMTTTTNESRPTYAVLAVGETPHWKSEPPPPPRRALAMIQYDYVTNSGSLIDVLA